MTILQWSCLFIAVHLETAPVFDNTSASNSGHRLRIKRLKTIRLTLPGYFFATHSLMRNFQFMTLLLVLLSVSLGYAQLPHSADPALKDFVYSEQMVNDKVENLNVFDSIKGVNLAAPYRPEQQKSFQLETYLVPLSEVVVIQTKNNVPRFTQVQNTETYVKFFIHPVSQNFFEPFIGQYAKTSDKYFATPLSSYRSLLAWKNVTDDVQPNIFGIKVSLDTEIGGTRRLLSRSQIERASATSLAINLTDHKEYNKKGIFFIDEPVSVYLRDHEYGFSYRETPKLSSDERIIPLFSLYAKKGKNQSMLQDMIEKSGLGYREFTRKNIIAPMTQHMLDLYFNEGMINEPHEQNVCIKIKDGKLTQDFYYRDLAGFHFDPEMRQQAGKDMNFIPKEFNIQNLKIGRAQLIENLQSYLLNSNFYALKSAVKSNSVNSAWIESIVFEIVQAEILKRTGYNVSDWTTAKAAITKHKRHTKRSCSALFAGEL